MKFSADLSESPWLITAFEPGRIRVGQEYHEENLLLMPDRLRQPWPVACLEELTQEAVQELTRYQPDLILFGTGEIQRFPPPALLAPLMEARIGHEVMDTAAACRTYNILLNEGRPVLAALIV
ncbi:MAG TPA: hypothetical protein EYP90_09915 [Chromatiaceae bacterium]|nr:hypothetical protein [Chromatiaceae bacterium]